MKLAEHFQHLRHASVPKELEDRFQVALEAFPSRRTRDRLRAVVRQRGVELCSASEHAALIPHLEAHRRLHLAGEVYSVGYGGNGAGERYAWHFAKKRAMERLLSRGLQKETAESVWSWFSDFPHRFVQLRTATY
jgi:hypothetical protein